MVTPQQLKELRKKVNELKNEVSAALLLNHPQEYENPFELQANLQMLDAFQAISHIIHLHWSVQTKKLNMDTEE